MTAKEYNEADRDVEGVCSANHNRWKAAEERRTAVVYSDSPFEGEEDLMSHRRKQLKRVLYTCARIAPGLVFLGAIPREWMDPGFAVVCALGCFITAVCYYRRGYAHGE